MIDDGFIAGLILYTSALLTALFFVIDFFSICFHITFDIKNKRYSARYNNLTIFLYIIPTIVTIVLNKILKDSTIIPIGYATFVFIISLRFMKHTSYTDVFSYVYSKSQLKNYINNTVKRYGEKHMIIGHIFNVNNSKSNNDDNKDRQSFIVRMNREILRNKVRSLLKEENTYVFV